MINQRLESEKRIDDVLNNVSFENVKDREEIKPKLRTLRRMREPIRKLEGKISELYKELEEAIFCK